jgi:hypothetical protein
VSALARRYAGGALLSAGVALLSVPAAAADWQFDPKLEGGALYYDNYTLARPRDGEVGIEGLYADVDLGLRLVEPTTTWRISPRVRARYFPDSSEWDSNDYFLSAGVTKRGQRAEFGVSADYYDEDVTSSELPGTDFGNVDLGQGGTIDGGRVVVDNRRELIMLRPYAAFTLTERTELSFDAGLFDVAFEDEVADAQESYRSLFGGISLARRVTEQSKVGLRLQFTQIDPDGLNGDSDVAGARVQWDYQIAERVRGYARAGVDRSTIATLTVLPMGVLVRGEREETTPMFAAGAEWTFQRSMLFLDLQRNIDGSAAGEVVTRDDLRVSFRHRFTTRLTGTLAAYVVRDGSVLDSSTFADRDYMAASGSLEWRFRRALAVGGQLELNRQEFDGDPQDADGTSIRLFLRYQPNRQE